MTGVDEVIPGNAYSKRNPAADLILFCFPYAGGGTLTYRHWSKNLPTQVEVCPVQLPGRGNRLRETPFTRMEPLVKAIRREIGFYLDKPFAFFGHSMGAIICFEIARLLQREGATLPLRLFVSGRRAPQLSEPRMPTYHLPDSEFIQDLHRLNGTPAEILNHPEVMQVVLPYLRADFEVIQTYTYMDGPPLNIPLTAIGGLADFEISREHLEGWCAQTNRTCSVRMLPGDHFYLTTNQELLLPLLAQELYRDGLGK
jgi:medium-chain acyl-[acyl-carrier-protein] hydrolase